MTLQHFNALPLQAQLGVVHETGRFLASRWQDPCIVNLHLLPGFFFAELHYNPHINCVAMVHAFDSAGPLQNYADSLGMSTFTDSLPG